jgi:hypothetical protein
MAFAVLMAACVAPLPPIFSPASTVADSALATPMSPAFTATPAPTEAATAALASPTPDAAATVVALSAPVVLGAYPSPDGRWLAEVIRHECVTTEAGETLALDRLVVARTSSGPEHEVARQLQYCGGLGAFGLGGLSWATDSRYFYFTTAREGVPDGGCRAWVPPISRLHITDLGTATLDAAVRSPDGRWLAGWSPRDGSGAPAELVVWDMNGEEFLRVEAADPAAFNGPPVWAPGGTALAYLQTASYCPPPGHSRVVRVDMPSGKQTVLLQSEEPGFTDLAWDDPGALALTDAAGQPWRYDLATGKLIKP